jgi:hypothetical protein
MQRYRLTTLIDITRSQASRSETDHIKIGQQSNFNTFLQSIGLRSNIEWTEDPIRHEGRLPKPFDGRAAFWVWEFDVERDEVFFKNGDPVGHLHDDLNAVPILPTLTNTADITPATIQTQGIGINTWVEIIWS